MNLKNSGELQGSSGMFTEVQNRQIGCGLGVEKNSQLLCTYYLQITYPIPILNKLLCIEYAIVKTDYSTFHQSKPLLTHCWLRKAVYGTPSLLAIA